MAILRLKKKTLIYNKQSLNRVGKLLYSWCQKPIRIPITTISTFPAVYCGFFVCFLFDQIQSYFEKWPDRYGGSPYWCYQLHLPTQRKITSFIYTARPSSSISGLMDSQVGNGVVDKVYGHANPGLPISMINIQRNCQLLETGEVEEIIKLSSKVITSSTSSLLNNTNLPFHLLFQILTSAYQLLNVTQPGYFEDFWLCVFLLGLAYNCHLWLLQWLCQITLLCLSPTALTLRLPWRHTFFISPSLTWQTFKVSGTCYIEALISPDCNKIINLNTSSLPQCPTVHNTSILCDTPIYHCLPSNWSGVCTLMLLFPKLGVIHGEEPLPISVMDSLCPCLACLLPVHVLHLLIKGPIPLSHCPLSPLPSQEAASVSPPTSLNKFPMWDL